MDLVTLPRSSFVFKQKKKLKFLFFCGPGMCNQSGVLTVLVVTPKDPQQIGCVYLEGVFKIR